MPGFIYAKKKDGRFTDIKSSESDKEEGYMKLDTYNEELLNNYKAVFLNTEEYIEFIENDDKCGKIINFISGLNVNQFDWKYNYDILETILLRVEICDVKTKLRVDIIDIQMFHKSNDDTISLISTMFDQDLASLNVKYLMVYGLKFMQSKTLDELNNFVDVLYKYKCAPDYSCVMDKTSN